MNDLPVEAPERNIFATLYESPNTYLHYPSFGRIVVHEFDIHGNPNVLGFQVYLGGGSFSPVVRLGVANQCRWQEHIPSTHVDPLEEDAL